MNREEHLLVCLSEECAEVTHRVSKALRFSMDEVEDGQTLTNRERISQELNDLYAIATMLHMEEIIPPFMNGMGVERKMAKVERWMEHARNNGVLDRDD